MNDQKTCLCLFDVLHNPANRDPKLELSRYEEPIPLAVLMVLEVELSVESLLTDALMNYLEDSLARNEGLDENLEHHTIPSDVEERRLNYLVLMLELESLNLKMADDDRHIWLEEHEANP